jgi:cysteine desulfurase
MSLASHKTYGPKGIGALYVRRKPRVRIEAQMHGGGHERGMRSGTLPTHQIVGMGEAFRIAREEMATEGERIRALQQRLLRGLADIEQVFVNGRLDKRVPHNLNMSFNFVEGESLIMGIKGIAVSSGSACTSASLEPSYVLRALGRSDELAQPAHDDRPFHDGRGDRPRGGPDPRARGQAERTVATVGDVQGRHRHLHDPVDRTLIRR